MNIRCFLTGHEPNEHTDSGYHYCNRCGGHEFYNSRYHDETIKFYNEFYFVIPALARFYFWKFIGLFQRPVKKHPDDLPF